MGKNLLLAASLFLVTSNVICQQQANYGSNKGKYILVKNTRLNYEEYGKGTPLLLLHGGLESIHDFHLLIPTLAEHFRVIAFDRPGHGRSYHTDTLSYHLMADYTVALIRELKLDSLYLLGWSDGASTALLTASMLPGKVKKLVTCGADLNEDSKGSQPPANLAKITPEFVEKNWPDWLSNYKSLSPDGDKWKQFINNTVKMWLQADYISTPELAALSCKALVILGDRDVVKPEVGIKMNKLVKNSQLCILPNTSHFLLEEKPILVGEIVIEFLK